MTYVHGATTHKPQALRKTADQVRADLEHLRRIEAQIITETIARDAELTRIRAARRKLDPKATYQPTPEAIAYRDAHTAHLANMPSPIYGGPAGLRRATAEAAAHDAQKAAA